MSSITRLTNARLIREAAIVEEDLWIRDGVITAATSLPHQTFDAQGCFLAPGFIDLQINGAYGVDLSMEPHRISFLAHRLLRHGVTSFLPTVTTSSSERYKQVLPLLQPQSFADGAENLGIHLEGPFFHPQRAGCHPPEHLRTFSSDFQDLYSIYGSLEGVRLLTLACELPHAFEHIQQLRSLGIIVSLGHSNATFEEALTAFDNGIQSVTHLWNACSGLHHRAPGIPGAVCSRKDIFYGMIGDGLHVHPSILQLMWTLLPQKMILVSDAMAGLGMEPGLHSLGGQEVLIESKAAFLKDTHTLAGSLCPLDAMVRRLQAATHCSLPQAIATVTTHPAQLLGLEGQKGTLALGAAADLVLLDKDLNVCGCWVKGKLQFAP